MLLSVFLKFSNEVLEADYTDGRAVTRLDLWANTFSEVLYRYAVKIRDPDFDDTSVTELISRMNSSRQRTEFIAMLLGRLNAVGYDSQNFALVGSDTLALQRQKNQLKEFYQDPYQSMLADTAVSQDGLAARYKNLLASPWAARLNSRVLSPLIEDGDEALLELMQGELNSEILTELNQLLQVQGTEANLDAVTGKLITLKTRQEAIAQYLYSVFSELAKYNEPAKEYISDFDQYSLLKNSLVSCRGNCLTLSRLVAAAFDHGGNESIDRLSKNLDSMLPGKPHTVALLQSLRLMQDNLGLLTEMARLEEPIRGMMTLEQLFALIKDNPEDKDHYIIETPEHVMLLSRVLNRTEGYNRYLFFDSNMGAAITSDPAAWENAARNYLETRGYAISLYAAQTNDKGKPLFSVRKVKAGALGKVTLSTVDALNVEHLYLADIDKNKGLINEQGSVIARLSDVTTGDMTLTNEERQNILHDSYLHTQLTSLDDLQQQQQTALKEGIEQAATKPSLKKDKAYSGILDHALRFARGIKDIITAHGLEGSIPVVGAAVLEFDS